ncbi:probable carbohydrate esterase At4g34215 [Rutidosis leptorrhynchoides]|uniref:probable carbohydrate esterase At4g34215 n=1 Tax=Rutidosis leptorrhynchoides TaxID=125765 RepID=UPI003A9A3912
MCSLLIFYSCFLISFTVNGETTGKTIFLLAGQSNMAGRGGVINDKWDGYVPPQSSPNPSIFRLSADLNWQPASEPLHRDIDYYRACGVGPGMAFANSLLKRDSSIGVVGLVPCAVGGTNISEWAHGGQLYNQLIKRANAALNDGGTIKGLLWYQGESDTVYREDAELYKRRSERFFDHVRADLLLPTLPIIQVALASGAGPYIEIVREAQLDTWLVNLKTVDAKGLGLEPDRLHLTTTSQVSLGEMLAQVFPQAHHSSSFTSDASTTPHNFIIQFFNINLVHILFSLVIGNSFR